MRVVFSKLQNCPGFNDGDFRDSGSAFQHMGPETAKAREPNVTVLVRHEVKIALACCSQMTTSCDSWQWCARYNTHSMVTADNKAVRKDYFNNLKILLF